VYLYTPPPDRHTNTNTYMYCWGSVVGIVIRVQGGWYGVRLHEGTRDFSRLKFIQAGSVATQPSILWAVGIEQSGHEVDHSHPMPRLRMSGAVSPLRLYAFMVWTDITFLYIWYI
jgi:hypothetical protein